MKFGKARQCAAIVIGVLGATGCGISPGDYFAYRVTPGETDQTSGCFHPDTDPPPDQASDSSSVRKTATWFIYASVNDAYYLDDGTNTLEGVATDSGYQFSGKEVDVEYDMPQGMGSKRTTTDTFTVDIITDGNAISGTSTWRTTFACAGSTCGDRIPSCTRTTEFVGTYIEDVQIKHEL